MKGLLVKDLKLMSEQKRLVVLVFLIACMLARTNSTAFIVNYLAIFCSMLAISTISYDEFDNGNAFLFTLPITRKEYVREKYIFGVAVSAVVCFLATLVIVGYQNMVMEGYNWREEMIASVVGIFISGCLLSFLIPLQLKFGSEKGRLVLVGISGIIGIVCLGIAVAAKEMNMDVDIEELSRWLNAVHPGVLVASLLMAALALLLISYLISVRVMEKKEF